MLDDAYDEMLMKEAKREERASNEPRVSHGEVLREFRLKKDKS